MNGDPIHTALKRAAQQEAWHRWCTEPSSPGTALVIVCAWTTIFALIFFSIWAWFTHIQRRTMKTAHEEFMVIVAWEDGRFPLRAKDRVSVDTGYAIPDPPPTHAEMQEVARAAKMAMAKVLKARKKGKP